MQIQRLVQRSPVVHKKPAIARDFNQRRADVFHPREFNFARCIVRNNFDCIARSKHKSGQKTTQENSPNARSKSKSCANVFGCQNGFQNRCPGTSFPTPGRRQIDVGRWGRLKRRFNVSDAVTFAHVCRVPDAGYQESGGDSRDMPFACNVANPGFEQVHRGGSNSMQKRVESYEMDLTAARRK